MESDLEAKHQDSNRELSPAQLELRRANRQLIITTWIVGVAVVAAFVAFMITVVTLVS